MSDEVAESIRRWMRETMDAQGISARQWAIRAGVNPTTITRFVNSPDAPITSSRTLAKLAEALNIDAPHLPIVPIPAGARVKAEFLKVRYRVQAGVFEAFDNDLDYVAPPLPVPEDARFLGADQWLELVVGDSANLKAPDGTFVHVVDAVAMGYAPRTGDWVIAERKRASVRERTLKQVEVTPTGIRLWPRSTNPKWQTPINILAGVDDQENVEVAVVGLVVGAYSVF